jgi:acyl carrier protein
MAASIHDTVFDIVAQAFGRPVAELTGSLNLLTDLDAKSAQYFPLMRALEEEYDLDLQYQDFRSRCRTIDDIVAFVEEEA